MASLPARVWRKFTSLVADVGDNEKIGSGKWNDDLNIFLGTVCEALAALDLSADKVAFFTGASSASLTTLSSYGRLLIAANDNAAARALLATVNIAGDTMAGNLDFGGVYKATGLSAPVNATDAATKAYVDALATLVSGALIFKGAWDASAGTFPTTTGRKTGWFYKVSVAGTVNGVSFSVGDDLFAIVDDASGTTYAANWLKIEGSITRAEVEAAVGFTFGSLAALSTITTTHVSDLSANGKSLITAANYAAMKVLLGVTQADVSGLATTDSPTFAGLTLNGLLKFAGSTAAYPALKRNAAGLQARLADDSGFAVIEASTPAPADNSNKVATTAYADNAAGALPVNFISGFNIANQGTQDYITIGIGRCRDASNTVNQILSSGLTKRLNTTFAEGSNAGGFASGESLPAAGTVHIWLITKTDGTADVMANNHATSGLSPALPSGFVYKRRIRSLFTQSGHIPTIYNVGRYMYCTGVTDYSNTAARSASYLSLSVPSGIIVIPLLQIQIQMTSGGGGGNAYMTIAPGQSTGLSANVAVTNVDGDRNLGMRMAPHTNASGQVYMGVTIVSGTLVQCTVVTCGWIDDLDTI